MFATLNGVTLYFDVVGAGTVPTDRGMAPKPVLFVLHGGPGCDHTYFRPFLDILSDRVQLIYVDHRGNGRSSKAEASTYTIEQMADDLEALRLHLGLRSINVLGHSFGGMLAQVYATRYGASITSLILSNTSPSAGFWDEAQAMADRMATPQQREFIPVLFEGRIESQAEWDRWWDVCLPLYFKNPDPDVLAAVNARSQGAFEVANYMMAKEIPHYDVRQQLPTLQIPTLVVAGRDDWVTPVGQSVEISNLMPGAELVIQEECGHYGFIEKNREYVALVLEFLDSQRVPSPSVD
jgi:proline iminopeptidase